MSDLFLLTLNLTWAALTVVFLTAVGKIYLHREQLPEVKPEGKLPKLSIIIPARDEATNIGECLQCITRLEYPGGELEVLVVDDNSTDATASMVTHHALNDQRIRLVTAEPLPEGWMGKSHACWQGVQVASGEWLLFIDADTFLQPTAVCAALDYALREGREFLSVSPFQRIVSLQERIVLPGVFLGFASAIDFKRVNDPDDPFAIANGQFLLFSRKAYDRIGGHQAIRAETMDDLAFARAAKHQRISAYMLFGEQQIETRMYRTIREIWNGFSKNALEIMHATSVVGTVVDALISFGLGVGVLLPFIMLASSRSTDSLLGSVSTTISFATLAVLILVFTLSLRALRVPVIYLVTFPVGLVMHGAIIINAYLRQKKKPGMERPALLIIACVMGFTSVTLAEAPDDSWRKIREGEHVAVYKRDVSDSKYDESLAQTVINASLSALVALIMDGDSFTQWVDTVEESRQLDIVSPSEVYNYTLSGAPWPVSDRDAVVFSRVEQDSKTLVVTISSSAKPDYSPERNGVVRVPYVDASWTLIPQPDGAVEVSYRVHNDPGGELPTWLINSLATDQPYNTLENLRRFFDQENKYRSAVLPHIKEPGT